MCVRLCSTFKLPRLAGQTPSCAPWTFLWCNQYGGTAIVPYFQLEIVCLRGSLTPQSAGSTFASTSRTCTLTGKSWDSLACASFVCVRTFARARPQRYPCTSSWRRGPLLQEAESAGHQFEHSLLPQRCFWATCVCVCARVRLCVWLQLASLNCASLGHIAHAFADLFLP